MNFQIQNMQKRVKGGRLHKLKQLTEWFNLPAYMGELFLKELRLLKDGEPDNGAVDIAKQLGVW